MWKAKATFKQFASAITFFVKGGYFVDDKNKNANQNNQNTGNKANNKNNVDFANEINVDMDKKNPNKK